MFSTRRLLLVTMVPLLAFLMACSSGDDNGDSGSSDDGGNEPAATQPAGGGDGRSSDSGDSGDGSSDGPSQSDNEAAAALENCPELLAFANAASQGAFGAGGTGNAGEDLELTAEFFQQLAANAPGEISADMQIVADAFGQFFQLVQELEIDFTDPSTFASLTPEEVARLESVTTEMDTPELQQALANVDAYFQAECS